MSGDQIDLMGALEAAVRRARQRAKDYEPCETCGGDRLRADFTGSGRCHAPRAGDNREEQNS